VGFSLLKEIPGSLFSPPLTRRPPSRHFMLFLFLWTGARSTVSVPKFLHDSRMETSSLRIGDHWPLTSDSVQTKAFPPSSPLEKCSSVNLFSTEGNFLPEKSSSVPPFLLRTGSVAPPLPFRFPEQGWISCCFFSPGGWACLLSPRGYTD